MLPVIPIVLWGSTAALGAYGATQAGRGFLARSDAKRIYERLKQREAHLIAKKQNLVRRGNKVTEQDVALFTQAETLFAAYAKLAETIEKELQRTYQRKRNNYEQSDWKGVDTKAPSNHFKGVGSLALDGAKATAAGVAARKAALLAIRQFGAASTGTAIRSLSGVAAQRATLSAAGGGAAAMGGGGMAAGLAALNVLAIGGTVAIFGQRFLKGQQAKLQEAQKIESQANAELDAFEGELAVFEQTLELEEARVRDAATLHEKLVVELKRARKAFAENATQRAADILAFAKEDLETFATMIRMPDPALVA